MDRKQNVEQQIKRWRRKLKLAVTMLEKYEAKLLRIEKYQELQEKIAKGEIPKPEKKPKKVKRVFKLSEPLDSAQAV